MRRTAHGEKKYAFLLAYLIKLCDDLQWAPASKKRKIWVESRFPLSAELPACCYFSCSQFLVFGALQDIACFLVMYRFSRPPCSRHPSSRLMRQPAVGYCVSLR